MIKLDEIRMVYLIGIGGIGMSALARYFRSRGLLVAGYDRTSTTLTKELEEEDMAIHYSDDIALIPEDIKLDHNRNHLLVIYTPAIPANSNELNYFKSNNYELYKRSQVLGMITKGSESIAVAGTHGKTTTSSMVAHVLKFSGYDCNAFLGGITANYNSNLLLSDLSTTTVVEADEYDRSFLQLYPDIAVLTSLDPDHLDIYGTAETMQATYREFVSQIKQGGLLIHKKGLDLQPKVKALTYSATESADVEAKNIRVENGAFVYDVHSSKGKIKDIHLHFPGTHNVENSLAAIAVAQYLKIDSTQIKLALENFKGVKRRFETICNTGKTIYIDDYAHHPEELNACISSLRKLFPDKKLCGIFQPHLFTRTRDFSNDFARSLEGLDQIILMEIYPAREEPIEGIHAKYLLDLIQHDNKSIMGPNEILNYLQHHDPEVLVTLGAGDIDKLIQPIKELLQNKN